MGTVLNRAALTSLLRDTSLITLASAIALGWALFKVAEGLATFVVTLLGDYSGDGLDIYPGIPEMSGALVWQVDGRVIFLSPLAAGLIEFAVVLLIVLALRRNTASRGPT